MHIYKKENARLLCDLGVPVVSTIQYFSRHRTAPYMTMVTEEGGMEDASLEEAIRDPDTVTDVLCKKGGKDNLLRRDIELLADDANGVYGLIDFLRRQQRYIKYAGV